MGPAVSGHRSEPSQPFQTTFDEVAQLFGAFSTPDDRYTFAVFTQLHYDLFLHSDRPLRERVACAELRAFVYSTECVSRRLTGAPATSGQKPFRKRLPRSPVTPSFSASGSRPCGGAKSDVYSPASNSFLVRGCYARKFPIDDISGKKGGSIGVHQFSSSMSQCSGTRLAEIDFTVFNCGPWLLMLAIPAFDLSWRSVK